MPKVEPNYYLTADLHLCHQNIIKYCNRPFKTIEQMNQQLIDNWNSVVKPTDIVWVLGDFILSRNVEDYIAFLKVLNGREIRLLKGNHDQERYIKKAQAKIGHRFIYYDSYTVEPAIKGEKYFLSHFPHVSWNASFHGRKHFYGHTHAEPIIKIPNSYNVGVDVNEFKPILLEDAVNSVYT